MMVKMHFLRIVLILLQILEKKITYIYYHILHKSRISKTSPGGQHG